MLWDAVRTMVDKRNAFGQFILTGSNSIDDKKRKKQIRHSGGENFSLPTIIYRQFAIWIFPQLIIQSAMNA